MQQDNKKILIIAYHFPPDSSVGALRPQKFAKYLPQFGWTPHILTVKTKFIEKQDSKRLNDVVNIPIHRTSFFRTPRQLLLDARNFFTSQHTSPKPHETKTTSQNTSARKPERSSLAADIKNFIIGINWFPDDKFFWTIPAFFAGYRLIKKERIDVVYATAPPWTSLFIGYLLSKATNTHFVVDYRDPWAIFRSSRYNQIFPKIFKTWEEQMERLVVKQSSLVITTTDRLTRLLADKFSKNSHHTRFHTITNGYDPDDFPQNIEKDRSVPTLKITYLGTFYLNRSPLIFLKALVRALARNPGLRDDIDVRFIGAVENIVGPEIKNLLSANGLQEKVKFSPPLPYDKAITEMYRSDVLLLFAPDQNLQIPGKTFEYIATQNQILALTDDGATADLIRKTKAGIVVDQNDEEGILQAIETLYYQRGEKSGTMRQDYDVSVYSRINLTKSLVKQLETLTNREN